MSYDVVVAGAGVGGASCALALAQHAGLRVLLVEQHKGPGNLNRGDNLLPTVTAYLHAWGVLPRFYEAGAWELERMQVFGPRGLLMDAPLPRGAQAPYLVLAHPEIERVLVEAALATGRVDVRYATRVTGLERAGGRVRAALLAEPGGDPQPVAARVVVGADGARSQVRKALGLELTRQPYAHGYYGIQLDRPPDYQDAMRLELSDEGGVLVVPSFRPGRIGLGVLVQREQEALFRSGSLEEKLAAIRRRSRLFADLPAHTEGAHLYRLSRAHARRYVSAGAALLGDAVHVTNPVAGQGMTMAIEDAAALGRLLGPRLMHGADDAALDRALRAYQRERRPRNAAILRWSHWMSHAYAWPGVWASRLRRRLFSLGGSPLGRRIHASLWGRFGTRQPPR